MLVTQLFVRSRCCLGVLVNLAFGKLGKRFVGLPFLGESGLEQFHCAIEAKLHRPCLQGAVAGNFIVFDGLGRSETVS